MIFIEIMNKKEMHFRNYFYHILSAYIHTDKPKHSLKYYIFLPLSHTLILSFYTLQVYVSIAFFRIHTLNYVNRKSNGLRMQTHTLTLSHTHTRKQNGAHKFPVLRIRRDFMSVSEWAEDCLWWPTVDSSHLMDNARIFSIKRKTYISIESER